MTDPAKPARRTAVPNFSSGPCAKRPGWSVDALRQAAVGRSHRAKIGKDRLKAAIERSKAVLQMPADYRLAIVAGSDTGGERAAMIYAFSETANLWHRVSLGLFDSRLSGASSSGPAARRARAANVS